MIVVLEGTAHGEEHRADDAVSEHHEQRSSPTKRLHGCNTDEDNPHVGNRGVSDHFLEVRLTQTYNGAPNEGNHTEGHQPKLEVLGGVWEKGQR